VIKVAIDLYYADDIAAFAEFATRMSERAESRSWAATAGFNSGSAPVAPAAAVAVDKESKSAKGKAKKTEQPPAGEAPAPVVTGETTPDAAPAAAPIEKGGELTPIEARAALAAVIGDDEGKRVKLVELLKEKYGVASINDLTPEGRAAFVKLAQQEIK
jgi:hypothetical protein